MKKLFFLLIILLMIPLASSACSGRRVAATGWPGLTTDQDTAYLAAGPQIYAINLNNGSLKWQYPTEIDNNITFYAAPVLTDDGQLIVGGYNSVLYSLDPDNGNVNWTYEKAEDRYIASPLVTEEGIFAPSADGYVYAINFEGEDLWKPFKTDDPIWAQPSTASTCNCLYVASMDHHIYAVNIKNGEQIWKSEDLGGPIVSKPNTADGILYASTFANEILAIDTVTQTVLWRFKTQDWSWASPVVNEEHVYASDISGGFYALDIESGEQVWQLQPGGQIVSPPLIKDDLIYLGTSEGAFLILDKDGAIQQNNTLEGKIYTGIADAGDLILLTPIEHEDLLLGYDPSGVKKWGFSLSDDG